MILKKCSKCKEYNLTEKCRKCVGKAEDAHYKFIKLRDEDEIHPEFRRR
jgi:rRNA maturation protein Nop10